MRILVTGANGSLGRALIERLDDDASVEVFATDKDSMDICSLLDVDRAFTDAEPDLVYHLAGAKSAPDGEEHPELALMVNGVGTWIVSEAAKQHGAKLVTASTCKACDPETAYGASKLIAERITLNAGGWVARFFNVRETCGNVFRTWEELPEDEPLPVTRCERYFISLETAVDLLLWIPDQEPGRYAPFVDEPMSMLEVAATEYPGREVRMIPRRRGDREREPRVAKCEMGLLAGPKWPYEELVKHAKFRRIYSPYDPVPENAVYLKDFG